MKLIVFVVTISLCITSIKAIGQTPPELPLEIDDYEGFSLVEVRKHSNLLNTFVSLTPTYVVQAIKSKRMFPASYSVFMRYCFEKKTETGSEILYFLRAYDPKNAKGKIYYGTFTAATFGNHKEFGQFTVDKSFLRPSKK